MQARWHLLVAAACVHSSDALNSWAAIDVLETSPWESRKPSFSELPNPKNDSYGLRCGRWGRHQASLLVTAIVPAFPSKEDADGIGLLKLQRTIRSIHGVLGMEEAKIIVNFDAFHDAKNSSKAYKKKISEVKEWNDKHLEGKLTIFTNNEWTDRAEMLHRVFDWMKASGTLTPMVLVMPEDSPLDGLIDVALILAKLGCDAEVDYVRFLRLQDCIVGDDSGENLPCFEHPSTPLLHRVDQLNERPHFATTSFYLNSVLEHIPRSYRGLPGSFLHSAPHMWAYGKRGFMTRDANELGDWYLEVPQPSQTKQRDFGLSCHKASWDDAPRLVTAIVPSSPRKEDADGKGLEALQRTITSIRSTLGLATARIVVAFDAAPDDSTKDAKPLTSEQLASYKKKIADIGRWDPNVTIFLNKEWTHEAQMLRRVFDWLEEQGRSTPMLYIAQDDSPVTGEIDVPFILTMLSCDPSVDYVRFLWSHDCSEGHATNWNEPCEQHPETPFLHHVRRMSDRPHFATSAFYQDEIFDQISPDYRGAPERAVLLAPHMWIYGKRNHMLHDSNMLINSFNDFQPSAHQSQ